MGIDKKTNATYVALYVDKTKELMKRLEENSVAVSGEDEHKAKPQLIFNQDIGSPITDEYYFDDSDCEINYSGTCQTNEGEIYISLAIPLSDEVLIDILTYSVKRLNKLKSVLESLK